MRNHSPLDRKPLPAGLKIVTVLNFLVIGMLLLLGLWLGGYLPLPPAQGHEIKLIPIELPAAPARATASAQAAARPEPFRDRDSAAMPWQFREDGSLQWSDPAQRPRILQ